MDNSFSDSGMSGADAGFLAALGAAILALVVVALLINLILTYFIWSAYKVVPAQHQKFAPGLVWLCAVPCIGSLMMIFCAVMVPQSFQAAFRDAGRNDQGDCGFLLGLIGTIGVLVGGVVPIIGPLVSLGCFVVLIIYVVKLQGCKKALVGG